jgi:hypothetical protein
MNVEEQYIHIEGLMEPEVERPMFSVSGRSNRGDSSSSYSGSDATMDEVSSSSDTGRYRATRIIYSLLIGKCAAYHGKSYL